jgi:hypothetical protein
MRSSARCDVYFSSGNRCQKDIGHDGGHLWAAEHERALANTEAAPTVCPEETPLVGPSLETEREKLLDHYYQDQGIAPDGELRPLVSKLLRRVEIAEAAARREPGPGDRAMGGAPLPMATGQAKFDGWTVDYAYLCRVQDSIPPSEDGGVSLEDIEQVLLAALAIERSQTQGGARMRQRICKCGHSIEAHPQVEHCYSMCVVPGCKCTPHGFTERRAAAMNGEAPQGAPKRG